MEIQVIEKTNGRINRVTGTTIKGDIVMKNKQSFFEKDSSYKLLRTMLVEKYGKERTGSIYDIATIEFDKIIKQFPNISKGERSHTDAYIFPRIAMYKAMKNEIGSDAMPIIEELINIEGTKMGNMMKKMTALPFMGKIFLKLFAIVAKKQFGETKGFKQTFYSLSKNIVKFDITDCPYCRYCVLLKCPELIHTFCETDAYMFGNLSKIDFIREQTLEKGKKCDFTLTINKK